MANPREASRTASALAERIRRARLNRMERSLMRIDSPSPIRNAAASHRGGEEQEPGTDLEMRRLGGCQVDVEAHFTLFEVHSYHPAVSEEVGGLPHCENRHAVQTL